jgi:hypothetical protein
MSNCTSVNTLGQRWYGYDKTNGIERKIIEIISNFTTNLDFLIPISMGKVLQPLILSPLISEMSKLNSLGMMMRNGSIAYM